MPLRSPRPCIFSNNRRIFSEYLPVKLIFGNITVKLKLNLGISALWKKESIIIIVVPKNGCDKVGLRFSAYFNFSTTNLLGPYTMSELNLALNSGPRRKLILSSAIGSSDGVVKPSPRSPLANFGRNFSTSRNIHSSGFGRFREHVDMVDAI